MIALTMLAGAVAVLLVLAIPCHGETELPQQLSAKLEESGKKLRILMFSDPLLSHFVTLLAVGEELADRGHNVTLLSIVFENEQAKYKKHVEKHGVTLWNISSEDLVKIDLEAASKNISNHFVSFMLSMVKDYGSRLTKIMSSHLNASLGAGDWDLAIGNFAMQPLLACMASLHKSLPFVYISVNLEGAPYSFPSWPWPGQFAGASSDNLLFADRLLNVFYTVEYYAFCNGFFYYMLDPLAEFCPSVTLSHSLSAAGTYYPSILPTVIGFEYPRTISPLTDYVGALIPKTVAPLTAELEQWLGERPDRSVVYVSMGSMFALNEENGQAILNGVMKTHYSILWSLRKSNQWILQGLELDPNRVLISDWTPQTSVLGSKAIHSALLHGGFNGLSEALWNGVPVVVIPQMLEQLSTAGRVHYNKLGILLDTKSISSSTIAESVEALDAGVFRSKVAKIQKGFWIAGGVERAADLVEFYEKIGYAHLVPAYAKYQWSWIQYHNADVYATYLTALLLVLLCLRSCCKCVCRRCSSKDKKKKD